MVPLSTCTVDIPEAFWTYRLSWPFELLFLCHVFSAKCLASYGWTGSCWIASKSVLQGQLWPILANFRPFGLYASVLVAFAALPLHNLLLHANSRAWEGTLTPYMIAIRASTSLHLTKSCDVCWHSEPQDTGSNDYLLWQRRVSCWGCLLIQWWSDALSDRVVRWDIWAIAYWTPWNEMMACECDVLSLPSSYTKSVFRNLIYRHIYICIILFFVSSNM